MCLKALLSCLINQCDENNPVSYKAEVLIRCEFTVTILYSESNSIRTLVPRASDSIQFFCWDYYSVTVLCGDNAGPAGSQFTSPSTRSTVRVIHDGTYYDRLRSEYEKRRSKHCIFHV